MNLTPEYLAEQKDTIQRNFEGYKKNIRDPITKMRLNTCKQFLMTYDTNLHRSISVGSGGFEPIYLGLMHACDVHSISHELLMQRNWKGDFTVCSCTDLPFYVKQFDAAVCSEVIEHLPTEQDVIDTFKELNRVAKRWIVTTPTRDVHEPTHKFIFTLDDLQRLTADVQKDKTIFIEKQGLFWFIHNGERKIFV